MLYGDNKTTIEKTNSVRCDMWVRYPTSYPVADLDPGLVFRDLVEQEMMK